ncbi:hypothetical protein [Roseateles sp.]
MESLTAFAICFVSGLLSAAALSTYTTWITKKARMRAEEQAERTGQPG